MYAREYLEAAITLDQAMCSRKLYPHVSKIPAYFLLTHALELTLKAYLRHAGLTVEQLGSKDLGHDLVALYAKTRKLGLDALYELTAQDAQSFGELVAANEFHKLRYIQTGPAVHPFWEFVEPLAVRLHQAVAPFVGYTSLNIAYPAAAAQ